MDDQLWEASWEELPEAETDKDSEVSKDVVSEELYEEGSDEEGTDDEEEEPELVLISTTKRNVSPRTFPSVALLNGVESKFMLAAIWTPFALPIWKA